MQAVRCADALHDGRATLQKKKQFVSSLHNAVELFTKQYMLDICDYGVVEPKKISKKNIDLYSRFFAAIELNQFFLGLTNDELQTFFTIEFSQLNERIKEMITPPSWGDAFSTLKNLRNEQTHFYIHPDDFLKNEQFISLYNFMIDFYNGIKVKNYLPFCWWSDEETEDNEKKYMFDRTRLDSNFSFKSALCSSSIAKEIKKKLDNQEVQQKFSEYSTVLAAYLIEKCNLDSMNDYETLVDYLEMMNQYGLIEYESITDERPSILWENDGTAIEEDNMQTDLIGYVIKVKIKD